MIIIICTFFFSLLRPRKTAPATGYGGRPNVTVYRENPMMSRVRPASVVDDESFERGGDTDGVDRRIFLDM